MKVTFILCTNSDITLWEQQWNQKQTAGQPDNWLVRRMVRIISNNGQIIGLRLGRTIRTMGQFKKELVTSLAAQIGD